MFPHNFIENKSQEEFANNKISRRNSRATLCTWCLPPPSSTSSSPFSPSSSSTPGSPSSSWSPPSSLSSSPSFWPGSDWLCRGTKCNVVQLPAVEGASAKLKGLERRKVWTKIYHIYLEGVSAKLKGLSLAMVLGSCLNISARLKSGSIHCVYLQTVCIMQYMSLLLTNFIFVWIVWTC